MATPLLCTSPRRTPYTIRHKNRRVKWHNEDHIQRAVWRNRKPLEREVGDNTKDGTPGSWFKITVSVLQNCRQCTGEKGERSGFRGLCWAHVETLSTLLGTVCNLSFLVQGVNLLVYLRANSKKPYKVNRLTVGRTEEPV